MPDNDKFFISHKTYFEKWWTRDTKCVGLYNYKAPWKYYGNKPMFCIRTNGARKRNGDNCLDLHIHIGYLVFNYTNFDLQRKRKMEE